MGDTLAFLCCNLCGTFVGRPTASSATKKAAQTSEAATTAAKPPPAKRAKKTAEPERECFWGPAMDVCMCVHVC